MSQWRQKLVFLHPIASSTLPAVNIYLKDNFGSGSRSQLISATPALAPQHCLFYQRKYYSKQYLLFLHCDPCPHNEPDAWRMERVGLGRLKNDSFAKIINNIDLVLLKLYMAKNNNNRFWRKYKYYECFCEKFFCQLYVRA